MGLKVLVTGATGMLGGTLVPVFRSDGYEVYPTDIDTVEESVESLDVTNADQVLAAIERANPDFVVHLAAKTDVERCEVEVDDAFLVNAFGTQNVALACQEVGAVMVYMSTAGVFDGQKEEPYTEFDAPNPLNVYGKSKLEGERFVERLLDRYFIVRTSWLFGGGLENDKKFVGKVVRQILAGRKELFVVTDKIGTPTCTVDLSKCIAQMIRTNYYGLYHVVCKGRATRFEVARKTLEYLGRSDIELVPVSSEYFLREYFAPRAESEMLQNYLLELRGMNSMRNWETALKEYLNGSFSDVLKR
jgi:dTDP-4-dehydrorhamnose reductase